MSASLDISDKLQVQDYLLTKIIILISQRAEPGEWRHAYERVRIDSGDRWPHPNAYLLDYTLGRTIVAIDRVQQTSRGRVGFVDLFLSSIEVGALNSAEKMWAAEQLTHTSESVTVRLVARLLQPLHATELRQLTLHLPPPAHGGDN